MKSRNLIIIILSFLFILSCACSITGYLNKDKKNENTNINDNILNNNIKDKMKDNYNNNQDNNTSNNIISEDKEKTKKTYVEPEKILTEVLPVFNDYKIIDVPEGKFEETIKENGFEVIESDEDEYDDEEDENDKYESLILLSDTNYKVKEDEDYPNNVAYYDKTNNKIYAGYTLIKRINNDVIYLIESNGIRVDVLNESENKIVTLDLNAHPNCYSLYDTSYFNKSSDNYIIYRAVDSDDCNKDMFKFLLDNKLNVIQKDVYDFYNRKNKDLIVIKDNLITIYNKNFKILKEKTIKNISALSENYVLLNESSSLKLLSYEDIINDKNDIINMEIKLSKNQIIEDFNENEGKVTIEIIDYSKSEKEIKKLCKKDYLSGGFTLYNTIYTYDIKTKKLSKKNECYFRS